MSIKRRKIKELIADGAILAVQDGNHGEKHPTSGDYVASGIPFVMARDFKNGSLDLSGSCKIPKSLGDSLRIGFARPGDVLLTHKGTVGLVAIVPPISDYVMLTPQVTYYRTNEEKLHREYLKYAFLSPFFQNQLGSFSAQSTRPYIGITAQKDLEVDIPDLSTQRKIAGILSAYDDLIENNLRRIKILEEMAQSLYREWFVHFRFPGHESAKFVDSALNQIPKGWEVKAISDFGKVVTGKTPSKANEDFFGEDIPFLKTPDMHGQMFILRTNEYLSTIGAQSQSNKTLPVGSICVSCIGTIGVVSITTEPCQTNQQINSVVLADEVSREFLFFWLREAKQMLENLGSNGATMGNVNKSKFEGMKLVCPSGNLLNRFHILAAPMFEQIERLFRKIQNLRETRDLLLPKLLSPNI